MNWVAVSTYMFLVISSYFSNKYVLSTLGFRFPMVFQGWQTLVGFLILKLLAYVPSTTNPTLAGGSKLHFLILKKCHSNVGLFFCFLKLNGMKNLNRLFFHPCCLISLRDRKKADLNLLFHLILFYEKKST